MRFGGWLRGLVVSCVVFDGLVGWFAVWIWVIVLVLEMLFSWCLCYDCDFPGCLRLGGIV